jgi:hypothetical protein
MKRTQNDHVICYLATGKPLTPLMALRRWGVMRLGARVWELKKQGHPIDAEMVKRGGARVASYRLQPR